MARHDGLGSRLCDRRDDVAGRVAALVNHPGKRGEPGQPGKGGVGGTGGQGGEGGEGGTGERGPRGYRGSTWSGVVAYIILAVAVSVGLYFTAKNTHDVNNERADRSIQLNDYLARSCLRDQEKDAIFVGDPNHPGILQNSLNNVRHNTTIDKAIRAAAVLQLQHAINEIHAIDRRCIVRH